MSLRRILAASFALTLVASPTKAADRIGAAVVVVNQVTAVQNRDTRTLAPGGDIHQDELIEVAADASSELKLNDETKLALGSGSKLLLDKFVYDGGKTKGNIAVNLVKGAFRFVTGVAAKPSYVVRVPQASITVRGTIFDVFVQDNGVSWLLLHEGAVTVCNERGDKCRDLDEPGKLIRISDGNVGEPSRWKNLKQKTNFDDAFPFVDKKPQDGPAVLTRDAILIDIVPPKKDKPTRKTDRGSDDDDKPTKTTKKKRTEKASKDDNDKPKRKRVSRRDDDDDNSQIMDGMGIAIGIAGGMRFGKGGGRGGGRGGSMGGGSNRMPR